MIIIFLIVFSIPFIFLIVKSPKPLTLNNAREIDNLILNTNSDDYIRRKSNKLQNLNFENDVNVYVASNNGEYRFFNEARDEVEVIDSDYVLIVYDLNKSNSLMDVPYISELETHPLIEQYYNNHCPLSTETSQYDFDYGFMEKFKEMDSIQYGIHLQDKTQLLIE